MKIYIDDYDENLVIVTLPKFRCQFTYQKL